MSVSETFLVTFLATFLATLPAVYFGILLERRASTKRRIAEATQALRDATRAGSVIYNVRDWANGIHSAAVSNTPLGLTISVGSAASLRLLAEQGGTPKRLALELLVLADHVDRLHQVADPHLGAAVAVPSAANQMLADEADYVSKVCKSLIENCSRDLAKA